MTLSRDRRSRRVIHAKAATGSRPDYSATATADPALPNPPRAMTPRRCPICQRSFEPDESSPMPFCSERCRLIDLGRWLGERYGLSIEREEETPETDRPRDEQ
jgi:uncharacterized protein